MFYVFTNILSSRMCVCVWIKMCAIQKHKHTTMFTSCTYATNQVRLTFSRDLALTLAIADLSLSSFCFSLFVKCMYQAYEKSVLIFFFSYLYRHRISVYFTTKKKGERTSRQASKKKPSFMFIFDFPLWFACNLFFIFPLTLWLRLQLIWILCCSSYVCFFLYPRRITCDQDFMIERLILSWGSYNDRLCIAKVNYIHYMLSNILQTSAFF